MVRSIHETVLRDIFDIAKGLKDEDEIKRISNFNNRASFKSINTRAEALTLVFPCVASKNCDYQSAAMVTKALERKAVSLLTMLFAAVQITDANDAFEYVQRFHTNIDKSFNVDDFLHAMDGFVESHIIKNGLDEIQIMEAYEKVKEDMRENLNCYFEFTDISESSVGDFKVVNMGAGNKMIMNTCPINEAIDHAGEIGPRPQFNPPENNTGGTVTVYTGVGSLRVPHFVPEGEPYPVGSDEYNLAYTEWERDVAAWDQAARNLNASHQDTRAQQQMGLNIMSKAADLEQKNREFQHRQNMDRANLRIQQQKNDIEMQKLINSVNQNRLLDQDVKKANELQPTLMLVNFVAKGDNESYPVYSSFVIGVKAKLYVVDGQDIFNRFKIKSNEKNLLLNLVKVGTREISFFKDFLFAIDNAKLDAVAQSRRGSSSKMWKVLERRALKSKLKRSFNMINDATAITSIMVTADEVEFFRKTEYIDLENPRVMRKIMDAYNMLNFVIIDDNVEVAKFLTDSGDDTYELLTYNHLEKEQKDNTKKILNLMSKMR